MKKSLLILLVLFISTTNVFAQWDGNLNATIFRMDTMKVDFVKVRNQTNIEFWNVDDSGMYLHHGHTSAVNTSPGGSGATLVVSGATLYFLLDAVNEFLYFDFDIHEDWDANSDVIVEVTFALNVNETEGDDVYASILVDYFSETGETGDDMDAPKTQTRSVVHSINSTTNAGTIHSLTFMIDHDLADNVMNIHDEIHVRFWLNDVTSGSIVAAIRFIDLELMYRTKFPNRNFDSFPAEG